MDTVAYLAFGTLGILFIVCIYAIYCFDVKKIDKIIDSFDKKK